MRRPSVQTVMLYSCAVMVLSVSCTKKAATATTAPAPQTLAPGASAAPAASTAPIAGTAGTTLPSASASSVLNAGGSAATGTATVLNAPASGGAGSTAAGASATATTHAAWASVPAGYSLAMVTSWAAAAPGKKIVYIPVENASDPVMANTLRMAMAKAWNHLSWAPAIDIPADISNGAGLAFALDTQTMWGTAADRNWGYIANCTPKANIQVSPAPTQNCDSFNPAQPVSIPRFVFNATNGGPYANIHQTPPQFSDFQQKFSLGPVKYVATHHDAIVCGPRISAYRQVTIGNVSTWYSFTSDEFEGRDGGDINYTQAPTDADQRQTGSFNAGPGDGDTAIASEWWIQLPNGFMYWGIHGEGSQERGKAEYPFAIDPANWTDDQGSLATGRSCITCHAQGIQSAKSDAAVQGKNGWTAQSDLDVFYGTIRTKFQGALGQIAAGMSDNSDLNSQIVNGTVEPISKAIMLIEGPYAKGQNSYICQSFCNGKYGPSRGRNLCESLPATK